MEPVSVDFQRLRSQSGDRILECLAMEHLGLAGQLRTVWLRKIIVERALTRGDYVLSGGARSDYYIDKFSLFADPHILRRIARLFTPVISEYQSRHRRRHRTRRRGHRDRRLATVGIADDRRAQKTPRRTALSPTSTSKARTAPVSTCSCSKTSSRTDATCSSRRRGCAS